MDRANVATNEDLRLAWNPGLDNDESTLGEVLDSLPGDPPGDIPFLVKLFENPRSPIAFRGAIALDRHDCLHVILGRGILQQDEAFVIGFTMGTSGTITKLEARLYEWVCNHLMPRANHFDADQLKVFRLALELARSSGASRLYEVPLEKMRNLPLGLIRQRARIDSKALRAAFRRERELVPHTHASRRLPA
jgi:hypothetical protein